MTKEDLGVTYTTARWMFPRLLGTVYLIAFASWTIQFPGLWGQDGILPISTFLEQVDAYEQRTSESLFLQYPSLFHWFYSDVFAVAWGWGCCALSLIVVLGFGQGPLLLFLWFSYLSMASTGGIFMGYQWDALLLETGWIAVLFAPWSLVAKRGSSPPWGTTFLLHWLLFRLMLQSGYVKVAGGDEVWLNLKALQFHYETQPLPNSMSWWVHHLPAWFHSAGCALMHVVELILPFAIFCGRWGRLVACLGFSGLMAGVALTGNYNFFNLLTVALALTLIDDRQWSRWLTVAPSPRVTNDNPWRSPKRWVWCLVATVMIGQSLLVAQRTLAARVPSSPQWIPETWIATLHSPLSGFRSVNAYGLFQDMTTERPEIEVEVSDDGLLWLPIQFKWKPGPRDRMPGQVAPHQPRLDWQMWFAALYPGFDPGRDSNSSSPVFWFGRFLTTLLEHKQPVWDLVDRPPFPIEDIQHVRARLYQYRFTSPEERQRTGHIWKRNLVGHYSPSFTPRP